MSEVTSQSASLLQGSFLVKAVRAYLKAKFINPKEGLELDWPAWALEKRGVFVTLENHPEHTLRGCVGFPEPIFPLKDALLESAFSAAFRDSRFAPLSEEELAKITIEVSLLTKPRKILWKKDTGKSLLSAIVIGRDGLIAKYKSFSGLLLPQVPVEWNWGVPEFLSQTCKKAGLPGDFWVTNPDSISFYKFQSDIFAETSPDGKTARILAKKRE